MPKISKREAMAAMAAALAESEPHPYYQKFHKGEMINSQAKRVILNVYHHILRTEPDKSVASIARQTADFTGISKKTVLKLRQEKRKSMEADYMDEALSNILETDEAVIPGGGGNLQLVDATDPSAAPVPSSTPAAATTLKKRKKSRPPSPRSIVRKRPGIQKKRLDRYDPAVLALLRERYQQYVDISEKPRIIEFLERLNSDTTLPNFTIYSLRRLLHDMGLTVFKSRKKEESKKEESTTTTMMATTSPASRAPGVMPELIRAPHAYDYDEAVLTAIRLKLHCHGRRIAPSFEQFYREVNEDPNLPNFTRQTFLVILTDMGLSKFIKGL